MRGVVGRKLAALVLCALLLLALLWPALPALSKYAAWPHTPERPINILLAGTTPNYVEGASTWPWPAAPEDFSGLTDTIMLAQLQPSGGVKLLSIPRDTWVNIEGYGSGKINSANRRGGSKLLISTVENLLGLKVDHYALLSLNALRDLTDASGGVTLNVPERMRYDDNAGHLHVNLQPGEQHLSGSQVEGFLRFRHDASGDIGRVARQQLYLQALGQKLSSPLNLWRWPRVIGALDRNTKTDLDRQAVGEVLGALRGGHNLNTQTLPGNFGPRGSWTPDYPAIRQLIAAQFTDPNDPHTRSVALVNVDAPEGAARALQDRLRARGYSNVWIAELPRGPFPLTRVVPSAQVSSQATEGLQRDLGYGQTQRGGGVTQADLTVLLGADTPKP